MADLPAARLRFSRSSRMKLPGDFARARERGQRWVSGCLIANVLARRGFGQPAGGGNEQEDR